MIYLLYTVFTVVLVLFVYRRWQYNTVFHPKLYREAPFDERFRFLFVTAHDGVKLEGCVYEAAQSRGVVLYFGGRGQDSVGLLPKLAQCFENLTIVTFNYRGYGKSEGKPSEKAILEDSALVYEKVVKNFGPTQIIGYSLGCSVASYVAMRHSPQKLFLIAPFSSMKTLVKDSYGFVFPLIRYRFDTCSYLAKTASKIYIFVSRDDNIVPIKNAKRLQECADLEDFIEFEGLNHVEILCDERVVSGIETYLQ